MIQFVFKNLSAAGKKIIRNIYWALIGKVISVLNGLFVGIIIARYLGPEEFGLMSYVISIVTVFSVISSFGLDNIEIRELSKKNINKEDILGTSFILRVILGIITILVVVIYLIVSNEDAEIIVLVLIYSITILLLPFNIIKNYYISIAKNEFIAKSEIVRHIVSAIIKIIMLMFHAPLFAFIISGVVDVVFVCIGYIYLYNNQIGSFKKWKYNVLLAKKLLYESLPLFLSAIAVVVYQQIDQIIIGNILTKTEVGYYSTAVKITDLFFFLPVILVQTITPFLVRLKERDLENYLFVREKFVGLIVWVSVIISVFVSFLSSELIHLTFGNKYVMSIPVLEILIWKTVLMALSATSGQVIIIDGIQKYAVYRNIIGSLFCVIMNILLVPNCGIIGAAYISLITLLITSFLANLIIPPYYSIIKMQINAILFGWKNLSKLKKYIFDGTV